MYVFLLSKPMFQLAANEEVANKEAAIFKRCGGALRYAGVYGF
jgi:hypothetical protein